MNKPKVIYEVLVRLKPFSKDATKNPPPNECWRIALDLKDDKSADLLKLRIKLADTVYEIADQLEAANAYFNDQTWKNDLVNLLTSQASDRNTFFNQLQRVYPHVNNIVALQIMTWDQTVGKTNTLDTNNIESIKQKTNDLINSLINDENINSQAKSFTIKQLRKILEVIDYYQIYGNEGIIEIIEESVGHAFIHKNYHDFMKSENSQSWKDYLKNLSLVISTSDSFISLTNNIKNFLP